MSNVEKTTSFDSHYRDGAQTPDYETLEMSFLGSMLPGIVHNLATPLSGVIGATQLLEMRVGEQEKLIAELETASSRNADALRVQINKNKSNLDIMSRNARQLTELLQTIIRRFHRSANDLPQLQSLYETVSNELQFLDANLTYKHKVRKHFDLSTDPYVVYMCYRHVVAALDEAILRVLAIHDFSQGLVELSVKTAFDPQWGTVQVVAKFAETEDDPLTTDSLEMYLARTAENGCAYQVEHTSGLLKLELKVPRQCPTA
ncbi:hypothetical protein IT157_05550 [bacterium]|jgi:uncharacterized coiled-coil protein SlyX|nr:hypothetical protein [bacterium]